MPQDSPSAVKTTCSLFVAAGLQLVNRSLLGLKLRQPRDGWRRGAGLVLRDRAANFVLSVFGLDFDSDTQQPPTQDPQLLQSRLSARLAGFLSEESETHFYIRRTPLPDFAESSAGPTYTLSFQPAVTGPARFVSPDEWTDSQNTTIHAPPALSASPPQGFDVLLNIVARIHSDGRADLWFRVDHSAADGTPIQGALTRLEKSWGASQATVYPTPEEFAPFTRLRPCKTRPGIAEIQTFIDFGPLLDWRKRQNSHLLVPLTISASLLWHLARDPAFAGIHMGSTVEIPPFNGLRRGVGIVVIRPQDYFSPPDGLAKYAADFGRLVDLTRRRASAALKNLDAAAFIPPALETFLLRRALNQAGTAFGSLVVSVIRDARIFGATIADAGLPHGFIALGSAALAAAGGKAVGCVTIKGPAARIASYPALLQKISATVQRKPN